MVTVLYKTHFSHRIAMQKNCLLNCTQNLPWVHYCTQFTVATKVYTFPLAGYNFDYSCKPWTHFIAVSAWVYTNACHP